MAGKNNKEEIARLTRYVEHLRQRLSGEVPAKFKNPEVFKQMISIDLRKTEAKIAKLKGV